MSSSPSSARVDSVADSQPGVRPPAAAPSSPPPAKSSWLKKGIFIFLAIGVAIVAGIYGWERLVFSWAHEETDDAQIEGHLDPVLPRVAGYVTEVLVRDNQRVKVGDPLVRIDSRDYDLKANQAAAALRSSEAMVVNVQAAVAVARANAETAAVAEKKAAADLVRDEALFKRGVITDKEYDQSKASADSTRAQHEALLRQIEAAESQLGVAQTQVGQRQADVDYAKLQISYTTLTAPSSGYVSRKTVEPGQYVQAGQNLLTITGDQEVWVIANFKETQLGKMHVGQQVEFKVDSYPKVQFHGKIESIAGATGAKFALLPPDNATGNFVKVTQRVPVKILVDQTGDAEHPLRPGLSVTATVDIQK